MFDKFFGQFKMPPTATPPSSPYQRPIIFHDLRELPGGVSARCGPLTPEDCAGHFKEYPAWPVAVVMHSLSRLAGKALQAQLGRACEYSVLEADVLAENLAFAAESLQMSASFVARQGDCFRFDCLALCGERKVGAMGLLLRVIDGA